MPNINLLGVLVAGLAGMVVGFMWYGPIFGKIWVKLMGFTKEAMEEAKKKSMASSYILGFLGQCATAYSLGAIISFTLQYFGGFSYQPFLWIWIGIVLPIQLVSVVWEGKSWKLFALNSAYYLVQIFLMGMIMWYLA